MQGIFYLLFLLGFGVVVHWYAKNDRLKPGEPTQGLLRMERTPPARGQARTL